MISFNNLNEFIPFGKWQWKPSENKFLCSNEFEELFGVGQVKGSSELENLTGIIHDEDVFLIQEVISDIENNLIDEKNVLYRIKTRQGSYRWMNCFISVINSEPLVIAGFQADVDKLKRETEYYKDIFVRYSKLVENFRGGILLETENRKVFFANNIFCDMFSLKMSPYDLVGVDCLEAGIFNSGIITDPDKFSVSLEIASLNKIPVLGEQFSLITGGILERDYIPVFDEEKFKGNLWLYRDITKFIQNEEKLQFRLNFEKLLTDLSAEFISIEWKNTDRELEKALGKLGRFIGAERAYIFLFSNDRKEYSNTHEWVRKGFHSQKEQSRNRPVSNIPWLMNKISRQKNIYINNILEVPSSASSERKMLEARNIKSLIISPMVYQNEAIGFVGFESTGRFAKWTDDIKKLLSVAAGIITSALKKKENEEALKKSEERYKQIFGLTSDFAISLCRTAGGKIFTDWIVGSLEEITGYSNEEVFDSAGNLTIIHPDDKSYAMEQRIGIFDKFSVASEYRIITKSGKTRWILEKGIAEPVSGKDITHRLYFASQDITERKLSEEKLAAERTLLRTIIDNIPDPIYVKDRAGRKILVNEAEMQILKASSLNDVIGKTDADLYPPDVAEKTRMEDERIMQSGIPVLNEEGSVVNKDGETKWFIGNKIPQRNAEGKVIGIVGISYNITERKKSEEALKINEAKYRSVVNSIKEVIFQTDVNRNWTFLNPAWKEITGFEIEESLGKACDFYIFDKDKEHATLLFAKLMEGKKEFCREELRFRTKDNQTRWIEIYARLKKDINGQVTGASGTLNDVTSRKKADEEIKNALAKEKELSSLKTNLMSMISHEFRTPLAAILSSSDLLELYWEKWPVDKRNNLLGKIKKSIKNLIDLLNDITDLNKVDSGRIVITPQNLDVNELLHEILEEMKTAFPIKPEIHTEIRETIKAVTDIKLMRQVLANLISNAIKYTPSDKSIYISAWEDEGFFLFSVRDEGIGIHEDDQKHLFEPFIRSRNVGTIKGTGLGLSILKRAVELLKGTIEFQSKLNEGSVFKVKIPLILKNENK